MTEIGFTAAAALACVAFAANAALESPLAGLVNLKEEAVLSGAVIGGNRLDLNRFNDERSPQALIEEVRAVWLLRPAPIHSVTRDGWLTLIQLAGSTVETFEVRYAGAGSEGRWTRWRKGDSDLVQRGDWLEQSLPAGGHVLERVVHQDGGRQMTTVVALTSGASRAIAVDLVSALEQRGFRSDPRTTPSLTDKKGTGNGKGMALFLARGPEDLAVTISEHAGQRAIVLHWGRAMP